MRSLKPDEDKSSLKLSRVNHPGFALIEIMVYAVVLGVFIGIVSETFPRALRNWYVFTETAVLSENRLMFLNIFEEDFNLGIKSQDVSSDIENLSFVIDQNFDGLFTEGYEIFSYKFFESSFILKKRLKNIRFYNALTGVENFEWVKSTRISRCYEMKLKMIRENTAKVFFFCDYK